MRTIKSSIPKTILIFSALFLLVSFSRVANIVSATTLVAYAPYPIGINLDVGQNITLNSNIIGGTPPFTYQWFNSSPATDGGYCPTLVDNPNNRVAGATSSTYLFNVTHVQSPPVIYFCYNVTDASGNTATSPNSVITVNPTPAISISPVSNTIYTGQSVLFSNTVSGGTAPYSFAYDISQYGRVAASGNYLITGNSIKFTNIAPTAQTFNVLESITDNIGVIASSSNSLITVLPSIACSGSGTYCTVALNVAPTAASNQWQICAGLSGNDGCTENGVPSVSFEEPYGSILNYVCTAANFGGSEYAFSSFSGGYSSASGCSSSAGIAVTRNINITANYVCSGIGSYCTVTLSVGPAAASGQWEVCAGLSGNDGCTGDGVSSNTFIEPYGSTLNYVCTAANFAGSGYYFSSYSGGYSTTNGCSSSAGVAINGNKVIDANYVPCYTLSINAPTSQITNLATGACGGYSYPSGTSVTFDLTPNSGYTNYPEYPCSPNYVMSGTYNLCATATGTGAGVYTIGMTQTTSENVNMNP